MGALEAQQAPALLALYPTTHSYLPGIASKR